MFDFEKYTNAPLFSVYARPVTYSPAERLATPDAPLQAIFDAEFEIVLDQLANSELTSSGHSTTVPVLTVRLVDFAAEPEQDDEIVVPGKGTFVVWDIRPDGEGCADLILRRA